jgi:hypothetical protein
MARAAFLLEDIFSGTVGKRLGGNRGNRAKKRRRCQK